MYVYVFMYTSYIFYLKIVNKLNVLCVNKTVLAMIKNGCHELYRTTKLMYNSCSSLKALQAGVLCIIIKHNHGNRQQHSNKHVGM